jgi:hypothetical protein
MCGTTEINESKIKNYMKITEFLDSKVNINPSLRQILPPTYTINFAKGNTTILSSGYNTTRM